MSGRLRNQTEVKISRSCQQGFAVELLQKGVQFENECVEHSDSRVAICRGKILAVLDWGREALNY